MASAAPILLSRPKLATFLACQRRFQLRYQARLPWPARPLTPTDEQRLDRGQQFHRLLERHFLGLPVVANTIDDRTLRSWWLTFAARPPVIPDGRRLPELSLTIPIGNHLLHGRFDLLIVGAGEDGPYAHLYDWKTSRPQDETRLRHDWQTRLYLALLAEGRAALGDAGPDVAQSALAPDHIQLTYWYVSEPEAPRTIRYSRQWHEQNWREIEQLVATIDMQLSESGPWPLTSDLTQCRPCAYQALCARQEAGAGVDIPEENEERDAATALAPELP